MMTSHKQYCLQYKKIGSNEWMNFLFDDQVNIGAGATCDLVLIDGNLSPVHFEIRENPVGIFVKDMDSESGKTLLGELVLEAGMPVELMFGKIIQAGDYEFRLLLAGSEEGGNSLHNGASSAKSGGIQQEVQNLYKQTGSRKLILIGAGLILVAVFGALSIYQFVLRPRQTAVGTTTALTDNVTPGVDETSVVTTAEFALESTAVLSDIEETIQTGGRGCFPRIAVIKS